MNITLGVVALSLLTGEPSQPQEKAKVRVSFSVMEVSPVEWRASQWSYLKPLERQGSSQVWTMANGSAGQYLKSAIRVAGSHADTCSQGEVASFRDSTARLFVTGLTHDVSSGAVAFKPQTEKVMDGYYGSVIVTDVDGGVRTKLDLSSSWVGDCRDVTISPMGNSQAGTCTVQLPNVVTAKVQGEWTIPSGRVLVVSLGQQTIGGKDGRVVERIAVIESVKMADSDDAVTPVAYHPGFKTDPGSGREIAVLAARPMPAVPSRSLLPAIGPDGRDVPPPALPDDQVAATSHETPSVVRPSPQTNAPRSAMRYDPSVAPARYLPTTTVGIDGAVLASGRPQTIRLPLGGRLAIELKATIVASDKPE